jgi:threonyl-tRNA synthetase
LHRHERSGTLQGLLRVQEFRQDDAHIFLPEEEVGAEYARIFEIADRFYSVFGLTYTLRLGTRPDHYVGDLESWDRAEAVLHEVLREHSGPDGYHVEEGDGAFYGPKIDILMKDALGREWQMGTVQLDFQQPKRFGCKYTDANGREQTPVVIHRVIYGSLERFIGILIEHTAGFFPPWIAPRQVAILPVNDDVEGEARVFADQLREAGLTTEVVPTFRGSIGARVRNARLMRIPYVFVFGRKEVEGKQVVVALRDGGKVQVDRDTAVERMTTAVTELHQTTSEAFLDLVAEEEKRKESKSDG